MSEYGARSVATFNAKPCAQERLAHQEVLLPGVAPEREHRVVLEQEEHVDDAPSLPVGHELRLQLEPLRIGQPAEPPDDQRARRQALCVLRLLCALRGALHSADSSNSWRPFFMWAMNRSASEPSTIR